MKSKSVVLLLFYLLLPVSMIAGSTNKQISLQLLKEARTAQALGDHETARVLFKKAKLADKTVKLPGWVRVGESPAKTQSRVAAQLIRKEDGARLLFSYQANPNEANRKLLETYLKLYPEAEEIRRIFTTKAEIVGQKTGLENEKENESQDSWITLKEVKIFVLISLILLLLWQTIALVYEYFVQGRNEL